MTDSRVTPQAAAAAAKVVRELFGYGCQHGRMAVTLDYVPCGQCDDCTHDWSPEAKVVLTAAAPLLCQPLQDEIDRLRAALEHSNRILDEYLRLGPIDVLAAALAAIPVGTGNPTQPRAADSARSVVPVSRVGGGSDV